MLGGEDKAGGAASKALCPVSRRLDPARFWTFTGPPADLTCTSSSWCMVGTDSSSAVRNAKHQTPQRGWRQGGITSGRGTVATRGGLRRVGYTLSPACCGPPTRGDPAAAGPAPELERDIRAGATQRQAMGRGWHMTWPIRMGFPPLGARTFAPKACADASSPLCALTWISLSSFTCGSARGRSCGGPWPRPQSRRRARQEWAPRASDRLHTVSATMSPVCREHRAAPSTPCPRAVPPTSQRDPHLEGQFHLDGERSRCAVRPPGPCTTLGRREGRSRGSLDEDTEDRSGHRAPTGREAVTDNSAQTPTPGFGPRATARCPPARWHG